jgi:hypothetical protein
MSEEGAEALADLVKHSRMQELQLYMNDIGDGGAYKARPYVVCVCVCVCVCVRERERERERERSYFSTASMWKGAPVMLRKYRLRESLTKLKLLQNWCTM